MTRVKVKKIYDALLGSKHFDLCLLLLVFGGIVVANAAWVLLEKRPPHWDMGRHLLTSLDYLHAFTRGNKGQLLTMYAYYPPLLYWLTLPFYLLFGAKIISATLVNSLFLFVLMASTYGIGRVIWGRWVGVAAAVVCVCSPMLASQFKEYQLDAPLASMVALSIFLLIKTDEFASRKYSILFGVALGLSMLTKWTAPLILALPLGYALIMSLVRLINGSKRGHLLNITLAGLISYAIASLWYVTNVHQIIIDLTLNGGAAGALEGDPVVGSLASNTWYLRNLFANQLQVGLTILLLAGLWFLVARKGSAKRNVYPLLLVAGTMLVFTILRNKDARYTLPAISGISILSVYWISYLRQAWRRALYVVVVLYSLLIFWLVSFGSQWLPDSISASVLGLPFTLVSQHGYIIGHPTNEDWHQEDAVVAVGKLGPRNALAYSGSDGMWFNGWGLRYFAANNKVPIVVDPTMANYLLVKIDADKPSALSPNLQSIARWPLPDGSLLILNKVIK